MWQVEQQYLSVEPSDTSSSTSTSAKQEREQHYKYVQATDQLRLSPIRQHLQCEDLYGPDLILHWRNHSEELCQAHGGDANIANNANRRSIQCFTAMHVTPYNKYTPTTCRFDNTLIKLRNNSWTTTCPFDFNQHRDKFAKRWFDSGAGFIVERMNLEDNTGNADSYRYQPKQTLPPQCDYVETRPTLMLMREQGSAANMFHELAQIMALYITKHVHDIGDDTDPSRLLLVAFDRHQRSSRDDFVGLCDEFLSAFATQDVLYEENIPENTCFTSATFVIAGEESPLAFWHRFAEEEDAFWHHRRAAGDDGQSLPCHDSPLLQSFVTFVLHGIGINHVLSTRREMSSATVCWIKRGEHDSRHIRGEDEFLSSLQNETSKSGDIALHVVDMVTDELQSLTSQILFTQNCNIMIGPHGAGLTHCLWMPTESVLIEILPRGFGSYRTLARGAGHQYLYVPASRGTVNWDMVRDVLDASLHLVANMDNRRSFDGL